MNSESILPSRVSLLQVVNDSPLPIDDGLLRHLYKKDSRNPILTPSNNSTDDPVNWDVSWFASYE